MDSAVTQCTADSLRLHVFGVDGWALTVGLVVLCVIWGAVLVVSSLMRWPCYWREPLLANVLVEISTTNVPSGSGGTRHKAHTFDVPPPPERNRKTHGPLRHTAITEDAAVAGTIANWLSFRSVLGN